MSGATFVFLYYFISALIIVVCWLFKDKTRYMQKISYNALTAYEVAYFRYKVRGVLALAVRYLILQKKLIQKEKNIFEAAVDAKSDHPIENFILSCAQDSVDISKFKKNDFYDEIE